MKTPPAVHKLLSSDDPEESGKREDLISNLRSQLALQQELCAQYQLDLAARDELVELLSARADLAEQEGKRRRGTMRSWRKKIEALEKACRSLGRMECEHSRIIENQARELLDANIREADVRHGMEAVAKDGERLDALMDELERLRRQVHDLQQESADKDVKIVQLNKQRAQDKEDLSGLNIALDSKQQELELVRRPNSLSSFFRR